MASFFTSASFTLALMGLASLPLAPVAAQTAVYNPLGQTEGNPAGIPPLDTDNPPLTLPDKQSETIFCPQDVKQCPDGSYTYRVPPTCEFSSCPVSGSQPVPTPLSSDTILFPPPTDNNTIVCAQDVKQCPDGSSVSRIPPTCGFAPCTGVGGQPLTADQPAAGDSSSSDFAAVYSAQSFTISGGSPYAGVVIDESTGLPAARLADGSSRLEQTLSVPPGGVDLYFSARSDSWSEDTQPAKVAFYRDNRAWKAFALAPDGQLHRYLAGRLDNSTTQTRSENISVRFLNDAYQPQQGKDRNVLLQELAALPVADTLDESFPTASDGERPALNNTSFLQRIVRTIRSAVQNVVSLFK